MTIAALTAAIVFFVGRPFLPPPNPTLSESNPSGRAAEAPPPALPAAGPPADARPPQAASAADATVAEGGSAAAAEVTPAPDAGAASGESDSTEPPDKARGTPAETQADKDLAREAWRANRPDIRVSGTQASILIPIKGSIAGGTYKVLTKTHVLVITLPHAASLNTQHFYRLKKHGFLVLWTDQAESNARAENGTKLRLVLGVPATPQVELRDDFVRVTIPRPEAALIGPSEPADGAEGSAGAEGEN